MPRNELPMIHHFKTHQCADRQAPETNAVIVLKQLNDDFSVIMLRVNKNFAPIARATILLALIKKNVEALAWYTSTVFLNPVLKQIFWKSRNKVEKNVLISMKGVVDAPLESIS